MKGSRPLYTAQEAANILGLSYKVLDRWVRNHKSPCIRVGRQRRFTIEDIEAIRAERKAAGL